MTVMVADSSKRFHGSGSTGPFTWSWRFLKNTDLRVYRIAEPDEADPSREVRELLVEGTDYSVTGASSYQGGVLALMSALALGQDLLVERMTETTQKISVRNQGNNFYPEVHEDVFDKLAMMAQDRDRNIVYNAQFNDGLRTRMTVAEADILIQYAKIAVLEAEVTGQDVIYEFLQPEGFGAVGDGVADDTDAIIEALDAGAGKMVSFRSGKTYLVNGELLRVYPGTTVWGYGATLKLKAGNYTAATYFLGNSTTISFDDNTDPASWDEDIRIFGVRIDGNLANVTTTHGTTGVHAYKVRGFSMRDVEISDLAGDIGVGYGFISSMNHDVYVERCYFGRSPRSNIYLWESSNCNVSNSKFDGSHYRDCMTIGGNDPAITPNYQTTTFFVTSCWMENTLPSSTHGIRISGPAVGFIDNVRITGYLADDGGGSGATATATVVGGVVTAVTPGAGGSGYETAPEVRIYGGGGRIATAHAVLTGDAVTSYVVDDGGSGYTGAPDVHVGGGTEGLYFVSTPGQHVVVSNVQIDNAQYGVLVESDSNAKQLEFHNLQVGLNGTVRNGLRFLSAGATVKVKGGIFKTTQRPFYVAYANQVFVDAALFDGGDTPISISAEEGGTTLFTNNTVTGMTSASYSVLVGGDAAAVPIIFGNTVVGNTVDQIRMIGGGRAFGNTPGVINTTTAITDQFTSGAVNPVTAPLMTGLRFYNTATKRYLLAKGTATAADWIDPALKGTVTNDDAVAGDIGELVSSLVASGAAVALVSETGKNVTSISLTAGDWDVEGNVNLVAAGATVTAMSAGISDTSITVPVDGSEVYNGQQSTVASFTGSITMPRKRISLAATTTIYLVTKATFSAGGISAFGSINARRVR
jgi:hypothetical protein